MPLFVLTHPRIVVALRGSPSNQRNLAKLAPATIQIPPQTITAYGRRNEHGHGPDIAWIPVSVEQAIEIQSRSASYGIFFNMSKSDREVQEVVKIWKKKGATKEREGDGKDVCYIVGWSAALQNPSDAGMLTLPAFQALLEHSWVEAGWQYEDYQIGAKNKVRPRSGSENKELHVGFNAPDRLGGVSGAGVWRIAEHPTENGRLVHHLEGILFYDYRTEERRYLRAHGYLSLMRILNAARVKGTKKPTEKEWVEILASYPNAEAGI